MLVDEISILGNRCKDYNLPLRCECGRGETEQELTCPPEPGQTYLRLTSLTSAVWDRRGSILEEGILA